MALNYVALTFTMQDAGQDAQAGSVVIFPTSVVTAAGITVVDETQVVRSLSSGTVTVSLVACDNTGTVPASGFWAYNIQLPGGAGGLYLVNYSNGASQRFDNLTPVVASTTYGPAASGGVSSVTAGDGSIVIGGTSAAPTVETGTLDAIATLHAPAGNWSNNSHKITSLANGSASSDAAAFGQIPTSAATIGGLLAANNLSDVSSAPSSRRNLFPWLFDITAYGAVGNGQVITDGAMNSGSATLTTGGLAAPSAPTVSNSGSGGTILAGTYQVEVTVVNAYGETVASSSSSTTTSGSTSTITITSPSQPDGNATGWYAYVTQPGGSTYTRQQTVGQPTNMGLNLTLTAPPSSSGANPPGANTTASTPFVNGDVGKLIMVKGAGASGVTTLVTTIASFVSSSSVTLTAANAAGSNVSGCQVLWATDDTTAINNASTAAQAYALAHGYAKLYSPAAPAGRYYGIGGALITTSSCNAQIPIAPVPQSAAAPVFEVAGDAAGTSSHWFQASPQAQGSTWISFGVFSSSGTQGTNINNFGDPSVLGGPSWGNYGAIVNGSVLFSNMHVKITAMNIITTHSANGLTYGASNLLGVAKCSTEDFTYSTTGLYLNGSGSGDFNSPNSFANGFSKGFLTPNNGNNDVNDHRNLICYGGYAWGLLATEHFDAHGLRILYCWSAFCPVGNYYGYQFGASPVGANHKIRWSMMSIEGCTNLVYVFGEGQSGIGPFLEGTIDTEASTPTFTDNGSGGILHALGTIRLAGEFNPANITIGATGLQIINEQQAPGPAGSVTLTAGTAKQLTAYRPATLNLFGGSALTAVQIGNTMGGASAPTMTSVFTQSSGVLPPVTVRVPPGGWIEVVGTTAPTANVTYD